MDHMSKLLTRDEFREAVLARDDYRCVLCGEVERGGVRLDAHHIVERRLFPDGGYYLDNGATVCDHVDGGASCHMKAEQTLVPCEALRNLVGASLVLPPHLYRDQEYDKWGNPILPDGRRLRGELFGDESVQRALAPVLHLFTDKVKYPRTYHLPWSPGATDDDRVVDDVDAMFSGREVVVTVKMDGENTTMYRDYIHARSLEYSPHASRDRVKAMWAQVAHDIPEGWRVCGENLYAVHSIEYQRLDSYFHMLSIWNDKNECLSWNETKEWAALLGFHTVPELSRFKWTDGSAQMLQERGQMAAMNLCRDAFSGFAEGYVVRLADSFHYRDFRRGVAKWVRHNHVVHHDGHWASRPVTPNKLRNP